MRQISPTQWVRLGSQLDDAEHSLRQRMQAADFIDEEGPERAAIVQVMSDQELHELQDISQARSRMQDGSYGLCADCEADIAVERLLAYPTAKRCLACQQLHERRHPRAA
ncbi:TraR/DksA C4-type zinc finger protein [Herbaspirillum sp. AP02]|uniref:TraR/DksA family transcriptional regulator n=1 Tax=unclassified Herbaspirillum TaxID=2624150 RepID=UPI0018CA5103|nr:TraR/DksA C4-type zinc finger protein [Herbaspirillum sp. AP02]MBG7618045.1 TraR/DksA C4-type zinc finger protein [Herbaspirillum sp. AP02]